MPGILGIVTQMPRQEAEAQLHQMVKSMHHETFYRTGTWCDESLGVYVGWTVRKNSFSDGMPLCNEGGDITLVFSGEEYSEPGAAYRLREKGHTVNNTGSADYLVHLYEEEAKFPVNLNGRFHGLLADRRRQVAILFNDRFGMHRIYCHESKRGFYFAAEAKAILTVVPELRRADNQGLGELAACGCVLENRTLFEGIRLLPGAAMWVFARGEIQRKSKYFEPREWEDQAPLESEAYYRELVKVFSQALPKYFYSREPIAMSLTGGLDTRIIMAWRQFQPDSLPCYSFGSDFRPSRDVLVARKVAGLCGQSHKVIRVGQDFLSRFPQYAERTVYLTDGCADVRRSTDLYVTEQSADIAPVRMTGNYGGEVLRPTGPAFRPEEPPQGLFCPEFLSYLEGAVSTYARLVRAHRVSFSVFRQAPWHHYGLLALEQSQLSVRSPYLDNDLVRTVFRAPEAALLNNDTCLRLISDGNATLRKIRTDRGFAGSGGTVVSLPFRYFHNFTFKAEYAYDYGMPQWMARVDHLCAPLHLERLFLGRHKFYHFRVWYRDELSRYIREMLLDARSLSRPYLNGKALARMVHDHLEGNRNYTSAIHKVLTFELVHRLFLDHR